MSRLVRLILLSDHFDDKQYRESVDLPLTCHPVPKLTTFAFRSSEVTRLLLDLDSYRGTDPVLCFLFVFRVLPMFYHPFLVWCFGCLFIWEVCFPVCCRLANVTRIPKGPPSCSVDNYRSISITSVLSKVLERLVSVRLGRFNGRSGVLPILSFLVGEVWAGYL